MKNVIEIRNLMGDLEAYQKQLKRILEIQVIYEMITQITIIQRIKKIENRKC